METAKLIPKQNIIFYLNVLRFFKEGVNKIFISLVIRKIKKIEIAWLMQSDEELLENSKGDSNDKE